MRCNTALERPFGKIPQLLGKKIPRVDALRPHRVPMARSGGPSTLTTQGIAITVQIALVSATAAGGSDGGRDVGRSHADHGSIGVGCPRRSTAGPNHHAPDDHAASAERNRVNYACPPAATSPSNGGTQLPPVQVIQKQEQTPAAAKKTVAAKKPPPPLPAAPDHAANSPSGRHGRNRRRHGFDVAARRQLDPDREIPRRRRPRVCRGYSALGHHLCAEHHSADRVGRDPRRPAGQRLSAKPAVPRVQLLTPQWHTAGTSGLPERRAHQ